MNHVILCFPSWDSSIPESRLCIESFLFPIYPLWSCLANEELSSSFSQPCKYFGIQRYFVWAQQTTPDKPWNPFEISTTTRNCLKLHLSWIPRHKCKFALLGKLSSHSPFLFSLGHESDLFFFKFGHIWISIVIFYHSFLKCCLDKSWSWFENEQHSTHSEKIMWW